MSEPRPAPKRRFVILLVGMLGFATSPTEAAALPSACQYLSGLVSAAGPQFLSSYPTVRSGPLQDAAFLYDNDVAAIALAACGETGKAAQIGDAILFAQNHDRYWHDGRLRNGYLAGHADTNPLKLAGWWDAKQNMWVEDRYQVGSDTGNMAWTILALLAVSQATHDMRYRDGAIRIGSWLLQWRSKTGPGGFTGGTFAHEPTPVIETWKSTEHNTDLAAAFFGLAQATGDHKWLSPARAAQKFVRAMWRPDCACFAVGTKEDGKTRNSYLALDAQIWPLLALPGAAAKYAPVLKTTDEKLDQDGGVAYSEAKEGLWTEGTAQLALFLKLSGRDGEAAPLNRAVAGMRTADGSYYASSVKTLSTGFMLETDPTQPRQYFHIAHLAALSWAAIAERRYNPFNRNNTLP